MIEPGPANVQEPLIGAFKPWSSFLAETLAFSGRRRKFMIPSVIERGAGIDVGKNFVAVCIMIGRQMRNQGLNNAITAR